MANRKNGHLRRGESTACTKAFDRDKMNLLRGMWVWTTADLLSTPSQIDDLVQVAQTINLTDVYLYVSPQMYGDYAPGLASINSRVQANGVHVWALDGDRGYFETDTGEEKFMDGLKNMIDFNSKADSGSRFYGFHSDIEPQDNADTTVLPFHNGVAESDLSEQQKTDRDMCLQKWLNIHTRASNFLHSYDLPFAAAMPFWLHDYLGEPITLPWSKGTQPRTCVMDLMMPLVDEYIVMSYNTDPANAASRIEAQAQYASNMESSAPKVLGAMETEMGVGVKVSYGDTPGKGSKAVVLRDLEDVEGLLEKYEAFGGMAIHHFGSWEKLHE